MEHRDSRFYELEDIHDGRLKQKFFRPEISTPFYTILKSKKGLNLIFFRKRTHTLSFWPKTKRSFFFCNCITLVKPVTQLIFDKRFCSFYISAFVLVESIFLTFFSLFWPFFTCLYKRTHILSFLAKNKKTFFFWNCITLVKNVTQPITYYITD